MTVSGLTMIKAERQLRQVDRSAVNRFISLLCLKSDDPARYESEIEFGNRYTAHWDEPDIQQLSYLARNYGRKLAMSSIRFPCVRGYDGLEGG